MPKKTRSFSSWRQEKLATPEIAANYLNAALEDSPEMFLSALRNVAQARKMKTVAEESGITRESLYRSLSKEGNPTLETLHSVLEVLGLKIAVEPEKGEGQPTPPITGLILRGEQISADVINASISGIEQGLGIENLVPTTSAAVGVTGALTHSDPRCTGILTDFAGPTHNVPLSDFIVLGSIPMPMATPDTDPYRMNWMNPSYQRRERKRAIA